MTQPDPFEGKEPVPGLEHLGRAIVDMNGQPSGSMANYERTRDISYVPPTPEELAEQVSSIGDQIAGELGRTLS